MINNIMTNRKEVDKSQCIPGANVRLVYTKKYGPLPKGVCVCHHCDNGWCRNPDHWFLGSYSDNVNDAIVKRRHAMSKVTREQVKEIRDSFETITELANRLRLSRQIVYRIKARKSYTLG